jgi:hypothetical protein
VTYRLDDGDPTTPELVLEDRPVALVGSATLEADTVEVAGAAEILASNGVRVV